MTLNFPTDPGAQTPVNTYGPDSTPLSTDNGVLYTWDGDKWVANKQISYDGRYVNVTGDTMTGDLTVPSLNGGPLAGLRNRFINGSFDIWQRSIDVTSAGSAYKTADRWYIETNGVNTVSKRIDIDNTTNALKDEAPTTYGMRLHANGSPLEVRQCIELTKTGAAQDFPVGSQWWVTWYSDLRNGSTGNDGSFINCRVAFMDNASDAGANTQTIGPLANLGGRRWGFPITIATTPPATATCLRIDLITGNVNEFEFTGVQLEPGPVATPFEQRPIGLELSLCQRYYQTLKRLDMKMNVQSSSDNTRLENWVFATAMRAVPTDVGFTRSGGSSLSATIIESDCVLFSGKTGGTTGSITLVDLSADAEL